MKIFYLILSLIFVLSASAQTEFQPIQCGGEIPQEILQRTSEKIEIDNQKIQEKGRLSKRQYNRFNTQSNYFIDEMLRSGNIIFGSEVNDYVNRVGQYVLSKNPDFTEKIKFFVVKSPEVNAFSIHDGIIFVNLGLLAQLENEAQLAFILSHELIHYKYRHSINSYAEGIMLDQSQGKYRRLSQKERERKSFEYSHEHEYMADTSGFMEFYRNTGYDFEEVNKAFDVLLYSELPFDDIVFDFKYLETETYKINSKYILEKVAEVTVDESKDDAFTSHPNIKKRRQKIIGLIARQPNTKGKQYIISETEFKDIQKKARFEMSSMYLINLDYDKAFYNSYLLLQSYPNDLFLRKTIAYSLYGISSMKSNKGISKVLTPFKETQGHFQSVVYFFKNVNVGTLNGIAVRFLWQLHIENPQDHYITSLLDDAMRLLVYKNKMVYDQISLPKSEEFEISDSLKAVNANFEILSDEDLKKLSKYERIRYDKKYKELFGIKGLKLDQIAELDQSVLSNLKGDVAFKNYMLSIEGEDYKFVTSDDFNFSQTSSGLKTEFVVNPSYYRFINNNFIINDFESRKENANVNILQMSKRLNTPIVLSDVLYLKVDAVDQFNELAFFNSYLDEVMRIEDVHNGVIIPWQSNFIAPIQEKYGLRFVSTYVMAEFTSRNSVKEVFWPLIGSAVFLEALPFWGYTALSRNHQMFYRYACFDIQTHRFIFKYDNNTYVKFRPDYVRSSHYQALSGRMEKLSAKHYEKSKKETKEETED